MKLFTIKIIVLFVCKLFLFHSVALVAQEVEDSNAKEEGFYLIKDSRTGDLLIFSNGKNITGQFKGSDIDSIRFQSTKEEDVKTHDKKKISGVVVDKIPISAWKGFFLPGRPQYERGHDIKAFFIATTVASSLLGVTYGVFSWVQAEAKISSNKKPSNEDIKDKETIQKNGTNIVVISVVVGGLTYLYHLFDFWWLGKDDYTSLLSNANFPADANFSEAYQQLSRANAIHSGRNSLTQKKELDFQFSFQPDVVVTGASSYTNNNNNNNIYSFANMRYQAQARVVF